MADDDSTTTEQTEEQTEEERAADEALRASDWLRWALAQRDRGAAARRFADHLARRFPNPDNTTSTDSTTEGRNNS